jgi:hypothetical protein
MESCPYRDVALVSHTPSPLLLRNEAFEEQMRAETDGSVAAK